jgi:hypothetical protein
MANTYTAIATVTVGSGGAATMAFSSIPATYTDLCLKVSMRNTYAATYAVPCFRFNGNTSTIYTNLRVLGDGSGTGSTRDANTSYGVLAIGQAATSTANTFGNYELYIPNYAGSNNKSWSIDQVSENNATEAYAVLWAGIWADTSAINQIVILDPTGAAGNIVEYSTATLYGIKNS